MKRAIRHAIKKNKLRPTLLLCPFVLFVLLLCSHMTFRPAAPSNRATSAARRYGAREFALELVELSRTHRTIPAARDITIVYEETRQNGLGAQLLRLLDALAVADITGGSVCRIEKRYWNYGCGPYKGWACYFDTLLRDTPPCQYRTSCRSIEQLSPEQFLRQDCIKISGSKESALRAAEVMRLASDAHASHTKTTAVAYAVRFIPDMWHFNPRTRGMVESMMASLHMQPYVAMHVRRGDKQREVRLPALASYARAVNVLSPKHMPVFVATDDGAVIKPLKELLPGRQFYFLGSTPWRKGHLQKQLNRHYLKTNYNEVINLLTEMEILRRAEIFVGTYSSNLGRFVHVLRRGMRSISLDDAWEPGVAWRTFGKKYCLMSDADKLYCDAIQNKWGS